MSSDESASSYRFFVQMFINIFLCDRAQKIISKRVIKEEKISRVSYLIFAGFALALLAVNQATFMFFKDPNLYEQIGASRRLSILELKKWGA